MKTSTHGGRSLTAAIGIVVLAWAGAILAQAPAAPGGALPPAPPPRPKPAPLSADELARRIVPLVDDQVLAVGHADLAAIDAGAGAKAMKAALPPDGPKESAEDVSGFVEKLGLAGAHWLDYFVRAGGRDLYILLSTAEAPRGWAMLAVPLGERSDANVLAALLLQGTPIPSTRPANAPTEGFLGDETTAVAGGFLLVGPRATVAAARDVLTGKAKAPPERKELLTAFQSCADMQMQAILLPSADTRRVIEELMPEMPKEAGGGPSTALTRGMLWAAVGVDLSPQPALRVRAQAEDPNAAAAFAAWTGRALKALSEHPEVKTNLPALAGVVPLLTPKAQGNQAALDLSAKDIGRLLFDVVLPVVAKGRDEARRAAVGTNVRLLCQVVHVYAANHQNEFPPDLQTLVREKLVPAAALANPRRPADAVGYVYIKPPGKTDKAKGSDLMIYEAHDAWGDGISVGFVDGHVEVLGPREQDRFARLLAAARAATQPASRPAPEK